LNTSKNIIRVVNIRNYRPGNILAS